MSDCAEVTLTPARLAVVAFALSIVGLTAPADAYLALVAPGDAESRQKQVADESDCMLVGLGIEEAVFLVPPRAPYVEGSAPRLLEARAKGYPWAPDGALRPVTPDAPPQPGDLVWWAKVPGGAPEHVEHVVSVVQDGLVLTLVMVAGGERSATVAKPTRVADWVGGRLVDRGTKRAVLCVVDADLLAGIYGLAEAA